MNNLKNKFARFMEGRYGVDILSRDLLWMTVGVTILNIFVQNKFFSILPLLMFVFLYFRMFSKNFPKRYNENRVYTNFKGKVGKPFTKTFKRIKDFPKYKYLKCPNCKQKLRVPRGKKEIVVTCAKCRHKFDAKS